jgi:hypothetical protein
MTPRPPAAHDLSVNRRTFLTQSAYGLGGLAFALLQQRLGAAPAALPAGARPPGWNGALAAPHFPVKAKRIIHLCMAGGPSQFETFDWKPKLKELHGQPFPESFTRGQQLAQLQNTELKARGPFTAFRKHGKAGIEISELFPQLGTVADELCVIRSMQTEQINHDTAHAFMNTGSIIKGRPSMGSWLLYGLGAETQDLPGFIVLTSQGRFGLQPISARQWSSGVLPSRFQGIQFQSRGDAVHYIGNPEGVCQSTQRQVLDEIRRLNGLLADDVRDPEIATRIAQYEMAFKMQASVPELTDFPARPRHPRGLRHQGTRRRQLRLELPARAPPGRARRAHDPALPPRLGPPQWHLEPGMKAGAAEVDRATAALIQDLRQRGMLDDTLVLWGGEFGRTPMGQGSGRDHHILGFSVFLAGGGVKAGHHLRRHRRTRLPRRG